MIDKQTMFIDISRRLSLERQYLTDNKISLLPDGKAVRLLFGPMLNSHQIVFVV